MRARPLLVLPLLLSISSLSGCEKSPRERLQGKWVGEAIGPFHASQAVRADEWAKQTKVEFNGNNVTVAIPAEEARTGTFTIAKADKTDFDLVLKRKGGGEDKTSLSIAPDGKLHWKLDGGVELVMRKE